MSISSRPSETLGGFLADAAARFGTNDALYSGEVRWSYLELAREAARIADGLRGLGVRPGEPVGVPAQSPAATFVINGRERKS